MSLPNLVSVKTLPIFSSISFKDTGVINSIISKEEGGWQLTSDPEDDDGGWTYGGMTAPVFNEYFPGTTLDIITKYIADPLAVHYIQQDIYCIYYENYLLPVDDLVKEVGVDPIPAHLSCAINCGLGGFHSILTTSIQKKITFQTAWKDYYFNILLTNPSKVKYIHGWINRVWMYI